MGRLGVVVLAAALALGTVVLAAGLGVVAPFLGVDPYWGVGLGFIAGAALAAGVAWGAKAARRAEGPVGAGRFRRLGVRVAGGERAPDGQARPISARTAVAMTDFERRQHAPGAHLSFLRGSGEGLEEGLATHWEVTHFSRPERRLLRLQVVREAGGYRVTAEMENMGAWLDTMQADQRDAAWERLLLRNLEVTPDYADSPTVVRAVAAASRETPQGTPEIRIRQVTLAMERPTLEWAPTVFWIVEADLGDGIYRYYCDLQTSEVLRREQLVGAPARPS